MIRLTETVEETDIFVSDDPFITDRSKLIEKVKEMTTLTYIIPNKHSKIFHLVLNKILDHDYGIMITATETDNGNFYDVCLHFCFLYNRKEG